MKSTHHPTNKKPTGMGMCGRVVPLCGAIPQMEGGQWGRVCTLKVCTFFGIV